MIRIISVLLLVCLCNLACKSDKKKVVVDTKVITFTHEAQLDLVTQNDSLIKQLNIELAENDYERETGLMYRSSMKDSQGMLFIFPKDEYRSFYMKNTEIGLDIIYINSKMEIVSMQENAVPYNEKSLPSEAPAKYVLEVNAGNAQKWGLKAGDKIRFNRL